MAGVNVTRTFFGGIPQFPEDRQVTDGVELKEQILCSFSKCPVPLTLDEDLHLQYFSDDWLEFLDIGADEDFKKLKVLTPVETDAGMESIRQPDKTIVEMDDSACTITSIVEEACNDETISIK